MTVEVDVWAWRLDRLATGDGAELSDDERQRAARFFFDVDRDRFVAARSRVRQILGQYTGLAPGKLQFDRGPHGKPSLSGGPEFNFSDSSDIGILAVSPHGPLGVDVEFKRQVDFVDLAERYFSPAEYQRLLHTPDEDVTASFYRGWTRKEAFLKAVGTGLATRLDAFEVTIGKGEPPRMLRIDPAIDVDLAAWSLHVIDVASDFEAALAIRNAGRPVQIIVRESVRR